MNSFLYRILVLLLAVVIGANVLYAIPKYISSHYTLRGLEASQTKIYNNPDTTVYEVVQPWVALERLDTVMTERDQALTIYRGALIALVVLFIIGGVYFRR